MPSWFSAWLAYFASLVAAYTHGQPVPSAPLPISSPVAIVTAAPAPRDNDGPGHREPPGGDGDGPTASPQTWPSAIVVWPSAQPPSADPSAAPVPKSSDIPAPADSPSSAPSQPPAPIPRDTPVALSCTADSVGLPPISACFTGNSPLHHPVASLIRAGLLTAQPQAVADNYWRGGSGGFAGAGPIYVVVPGMATVSGVVGCTSGGNGCGHAMTLPRNYHIQPTSFDKHVASLNIGGSGVEMDCWECKGWPGNVQATGSYALAGGDGLLPGGRQGWTGVAGGEALGLFYVTGEDLIRAAKFGQPIGHALGFMSPCVGPGAGTWPDLGKQPDSLCKSGQSAVYGAIIHLKPSYNIAGNDGPYCAAMRQAVATFGAYVVDTGGTGKVQPYADVSGAMYDGVGEPNPWTSGPSLASDPGLVHGCFRDIPSGAIEVLNFTSDSPSLPPYIGYGDARN